MESYLQISYLNDFIFCPLSIYFHQLYGGIAKDLIDEGPQIEGKAAHAAVDEHRYSTHKCILQAIDIYSEKYGICGKIDIFDSRKGQLTERKKHIAVIYDGYRFQLFAQCLCLREMGYQVNDIRFYSSDDNKIYNISLPENDPDMFRKFETVILAIHEFNIDSFTPENPTKCLNCIYRNICDRPLVQNTLQGIP